MTARQLGPMILVLILAALPAAGGEEPPWRVEPAVFHVGAFFAGQEVVVAGPLAAGQEAVVEVRGPDEEARLDLKGRVGPLWLNTGQIEIDRVPSLYACLLPADGQWQERAAELGVGYGSLGRAARIKAPGRRPEELFAEFLKLKEALGLYTQRRGAMTYPPAPDGGRRGVARFTFPAATKPGQYQVTVNLVAGGAVQRQWRKTLRVEEAGLIWLVRDMAQQERLLFGCLAVAVALLAGLGMGLLFKGGKAH